MGFSSHGLWLKDVCFRLFQSNDVRVRLCLTLLGTSSLCLFLLNFAQFYRTFFDFVGSCSNFLNVFDFTES